MNTEQPSATAQLVEHVSQSTAAAFSDIAAQVVDQLTSEGAGKCSASVSLKFVNAKGRWYVKAKASTSSKQAGESESSFSLEPELPGVSGTTEGGEYGR